MKSAQIILSDSRTKGCTQTAHCTSPEKSGRTSTRASVCPLLEFGILICSIGGYQLGDNWFACVWCVCVCVCVCVCLYRHRRIEGITDMYLCGVHVFVCVYTQEMEVDRHWLAKVRLFLCSSLFWPFPCKSKSDVPLLQHTDATETLRSRQVVQHGHAAQETFAGHLRLGPL